MSNRLFSHLSILLYCILPFAVSAQDLYLQGYVVDSAARNGIPYAHIGLENSNIGTVSNPEGRFILKVPAQWARGFLKVSAIGYQTSRQPMQRLLGGADAVIVLAESPKMLSTLTVTAETPAQIVAHAHRNIPLNYPLTNTLYTGFYRESNLHTAPPEPEKYFYVIEAVMRFNKPSYEKPKPEGDIKLVQVRKNKFVESDKFTKFYAGAFTPMRFDVAKQRFDFLDSAFQDRYTYTLDNVTTYYDREVYVIGFRPAKKSADYEGQLFIDTETYALVKVDYAYSEGGRSRENALRSSWLKHREFHINYQPLGKLWYIESIWQQALGYDPIANDSLRYLTEYATTQIDTNQSEAFEYGDQIQWGEIFLTKTDPYDENFWKDYNIVAETKLLKAVLLDTAYQAQVAEKAIAAESAPKTAPDGPRRARFRPTYPLLGVYALRASAQQLSVAFQHETLPFGFAQTFDLANLSPAWSSGFGLEYDWYRNWYASLQFFGGFGLQRFNSANIGLGYRWLLTKEKKRPMHLIFSMDYAFSGYLKRIGEYDNKGATKLQVNGTTFENERVRADFFKRQHALLPRAAFSVEINRSFSLFAEMGWVIPLSNDEGIVISDKDAGVFDSRRGPQRQRIPLTDPRITFQTDGQSATELPLHASAFFQIGFKGFPRFR